MICNVYDMHNLFFFTLYSYVILHVRKHLFATYSTIKKEAEYIDVGCGVKPGLLNMTFSVRKVTPSGERTELQVINNKVVQFSPLSLLFLIIHQEKCYAE